MEVRAYPNDQPWNAAIDRENNCFAQDPDYISTVSKHHNGKGLIIEAVGRVPYFVPVMLTRKAFLRVATFLDIPRDRGGNPAAAVDEASAVDAAIAYLRSGGLADRISQPMNWCRFQSAPASAASAEFGSYVLDLRQPLQSIWTGLHQKHRNSIRMAEKSGVKVCAGPDHVRMFHKLYAATMERSRMQAERLAFFEELASKPGLSVHCAVAYDGDTALSALFVPYSRRGAFYLCGATAHSMTIGGANCYLHYHAIRQLRERGVESYDFVGARLSDVTGTKLEHIQRFKARFGGELKTGVLWKKDLNRIRCASFDALSSIKQTVTGVRSAGDIIDQERRKAPPVAGAD